MPSPHSVIGAWDGAVDEIYWHEHHRDGDDAHERGPSKNSTQEGVNEGRETYTNRYYQPQRPRPAAAGARGQHTRLQLSASAPGVSRSPRQPQRPLTGNGGRRHAPPRDNSGWMAATEPNPHAPDYNAAQNSQHHPTSSGRKQPQSKGKPPSTSRQLTPQREDRFTATSARGDTPASHKTPAAARSRSASKRRSPGPSASFKALEEELIRDGGLPDPQHRPASASPSQEHYYRALFGSRRRYPGAPSPQEDEEPRRPSTGPASSRQRPSSRSPPRSQASQVLPPSRPRLSSLHDSINVPQLSGPRVDQLMPALLEDLSTARARLQRLLGELQDVQGEKEQLLRQVQERRAYFEKLEQETSSLTRRARQQQQIQYRLQQEKNRQRKLRMMMQATGQQKQRFDNEFSARLRGEVNLCLHTGSHAIFHNTPSIMPTVACLRRAANKFAAEKAQLEKELEATQTTSSAVSLRAEREREQRRQARLRSEQARRTEAIVRARRELQELNESLKKTRGNNIFLTRQLNAMKEASARQRQAPSKHLVTAEEAQATADAAPPMVVTLPVMPRGKAAVQNNAAHASQGDADDEPVFLTEGAV